MDISLLAKANEQDETVKLSSTVTSKKAKSCNIVGEVAENSPLSVQLMPYSMT